ncbi:MAG: class I SAM-dependent methyltransferase [Xanthomonadales bacterium]|nr:class I SAM-dependent methyltransferase [Xanthomonadales bacterium]
MSVSSVQEEAQLFESKLSEIKRQSNVDFDWYPYHSLNNFYLIEELLTAGNLPDFFETMPAGKKILDIGCADGDVAFFFEQKGFVIDVVDRQATNFNNLKGCKYLKGKLQSKIRILELDIDRHFKLDTDYKLTFALGLLYHLRNPFYFLNMLCSHSESVLLSTRIASHAPDGTKIKNLTVAYLVGANELNNDPTNYWIFSLAGIRQLIKRAGFDIVCEKCFGEVDNSSPHESNKDERYFALLKRVDNFQGIFDHHHY